MILKDEAMFMRKSGGGSPVIDGLQCWLDGNGYDVSNNTIADSNTGNIYSIVGSPLTATKSKNSVILNGTGKFFSYINGMLHPRTVEVVVGKNLSDDVYFRLSDLTPQYQAVAGLYVGKYFNTTNNEVTFGHAWQTGTHIRSNIADENMHQYVGVVRFSDKQIDLYIDGKYVGTSNNTWDMKLLPFGFGSLSNSDHSMNFGCVRFYEQVLTEEEILQNYNYEKSLGRVE